jgi:hypothetical protein
MNRTRFILLLGLSLGVAGFGLLYTNRTASYREIERTCGPELAWVKREFRLNDADFERIRRLHQAYKPVCAAYCRRVDEKNRELASLMAVSTEVTPPIKTALNDAADLRKECLAQMLKHFYAVSQAMPPEQGRRYLAWVQTETLKPTYRTMLPGMSEEPMYGSDKQ